MWQIRPSIIAEYQTDSDTHWVALNASIAERDARYLALNHELGLRTSDGRFTSSHAPYAGDDYEQRYKAISDWHAPRYQALRDEHEVRRKAVGLTIPEFLFLDNFGGAELRTLCADARFAHSARFELIRMKASLLIDRWREDGNLAYVIHQAKCDAKLFSFAAMRCRAFFAIGIFNWRARVAIHDYRKEWESALNRSIFERRI